MENNDASKLELDAISKLQCLMLNNPYEFIEGIIKLAGQETYEMWGRGQYPIRPEDSSMTLKIKSWMAIVKSERKERERLNGEGQ